MCQMIAVEIGSALFTFEGGSRGRCATAVEEEGRVRKGGVRDGRRLLRCRMVRQQRGPDRWRANSHASPRTCQLSFLPQRVDRGTKTTR
jgi:hypothetical protein